MIVYSDLSTFIPLVILLNNVCTVAHGLLRSLTRDMNRYALLKIENIYIYLLTKQK